MTKNNNLTNLEDTNLNDLNLDTDLDIDFNDLGLDFGDDDDLSIDETPVNEEKEEVVESKEDDDLDIDDIEFEDLDIDLPEFEDKEEENISVPEVKEPTKEPVKEEVKEDDLTISDEEDFDIEEEELPLEDDGLEVGFEEEDDFEDEEEEVVVVEQPKKVTKTETKTTTKKEPTKVAPKKVTKKPEPKAEEKVTTETKTEGKKTKTPEERYQQQFAGAINEAKYEALFEKHVMTRVQAYNKIVADRASGKTTKLPSAKIVSHNDFITLAKAKIYSDEKYLQTFIKLFTSTKIDKFEALDALVNPNCISRPVMSDLFDFFMSIVKDILRAEGSFTLFADEDIKVNLTGEYKAEELRDITRLKKSKKYTHVLKSDYYKVSCKSPVSSSKIQGGVLDEDGNFVPVLD